MRILFSAVSAVLLLSSPLFAANPAMSESSPMSHGSHTIMADSAPAESYHSQGQIKIWHATRVSIAHSAIPALSWPPMTMTFDLPESLAAQPLPAGTSVTFSFRQTEQGYQLTAISAQQP